MKKNNILNIFYNDSFFEWISYLLMLLWAISPIIEYIFKNYISSLYTYYFVFAIIFVGFFGIIEYIMYIFVKVKNKKFAIKKHIPHILIAILLIIGIVSSICSSNSSLSFFGESYRKEGLIIYIMYIGFILSSSIIKDKTKIRNIFKVILVSALFITIMPFFNSNFTYKSFSNIYHQFNHYGYFLMISTMLAGFMFVDNNKYIKKIICLLIYIFLLYILICNNTFGCYLAMFISLLFALVYSLIKKYKRLDISILIFTFIIVSILVSFFNIRIGETNNSFNTKDIVSKNLSSLSNDMKIVSSKDEKNNSNKIGTGRGLLWKEAWNYTLKHPLIGGGMESLNAYYKANKVTYNDRPHNIILQISSFIGIPGAIIYIVLILYLAIVNLKFINKDTVNLMVYITAMCYFISSLFGNSMYYTSPYFMILLGLLISISNSNIDSEVKKI